MKTLRCIPAALCALLLATLEANRQATAEYHDFLLKDGCSFRGRIVAYDQHTDIVSIERADERLLKTSPAVFDDADQLHIKEWHITRCFQSERLFWIEAGRKVVGGQKWRTFSLGGSGGPSGQLRNTHYNILLENRSPVPFQNMTVEYQMYYQCGKEREMKSGNFMVLELNPKSKKQVRTEEYIPSHFKPGMVFMGPPGPDSKQVVKGIRIRITLPLSNDRKVVRDYCCPSGLSRRHKWTDKDVP